MKHIEFGVYIYIYICPVILNYPRICGSLVSTEFAVCCTKKRCIKVNLVGSNTKNESFNMQQLWMGSFIEDNLRP